MKQKSKEQNKDKTNVMRVLDSKKIDYVKRTYSADPTLSGDEIASILNLNADRVFKTLVTVSKSGNNYVFVIPVNAELNLKKAAKAVLEKSISMIKQKELLPLTGYVHGGCSPIGMKKPFPTYMHETAKQFETVFVSGGKVGYQIELSPKDLQEAAGIKYADLV